MRAELKDLKTKLGATFLFVTHDQIEAMSMGDRIAVLNAGRIAQVGTPYEMYNEPNDVFVAGFVGTPTMNYCPRKLGMEPPWRRQAGSSSASTVPRKNASPTPRDL